MDLNHLHLTSPNVEASVAFYRDFFDFSHAKKQESGAYFLHNREGFMIAIGPDEHTGRGEKVSMPEWFHYGFRLPSMEAVEDLYVKLQTSGQHIVEPLTKYADFVFFRCEDPAGFRLEIYWCPHSPKPGASPPVS